jgi:hypothetical protein
MSTSGQVRQLRDNELMAKIEPILESLAAYRQRAAEYNAMLTAKPIIVTSGRTSSRSMEPVGETVIPR